MFDLKVGSGAELDYVLAQQAGTRGRSVSQSSFWISEGGKVKAFTVSKGSLLTRTQINLYSEGESTQTQLYGIFLGDDKSHVDVRTNSEHLKPKGVSTQVQKGILFDEARGVFNGKITIAIDAQEVDAHMLNQNLLLGDLAEIDTKPELDVYADNVKASHGATVGSVNEDELFYLQSRGIGREQAQELIIQGFVLSELKHIESEQVRTWIKNLLMKKLSVTKEVFGG